MNYNYFLQLCQSVIFGFFYINLLLFIGKWLNDKITIFKKLYLPSALIGGLIGLLLFNGLFSKINHNLDKIYLVPQFLIVFIVSAIPLGFMYSFNQSNTVSSPLVRFKNIIIMYLILNLITLFQGITGLSITKIFNNLFKGDIFYLTFGLELMTGFSGGHSTSAIVGSLLNHMRENYWQVAQDVNITFATLGLIVGLIIGIIFININVLLGRLTITTQSNIMNKNKRNYVIDKINIASVLHIFLIIIISVISIFIFYLFKQFNLSILTIFPPWNITLILMFIVWYFLQKTNFRNYIDYQRNNKIISYLTNIIIVSSVSTMSIELIINLIIPIIIVSIFGIIITYLICYYFTKWFLNESTLKRFLVMWGTSTGTFITGLILLKTIQSDMDNIVLKDYSISHTLNSLTSFIFLPLTYYSLIIFNIEAGILFLSFLFLVFLILLIIFHKHFNIEQ